MDLDIVTRGSCPTVRTTFGAVLSHKSTSVPYATERINLRSGNYNHISTVTAITTVRSKTRHITRRLETNQPIATFSGSYKYFC
jgi:hypothetical protein